MSLPPRQQQVLDGIEGALEAGAPRLGSMFAIFTSLTRDEGAPRTETLPEPRIRRAWPAGGLTATLRAIIAVPLALGLVTLFVFMAINGSSAQGCRPGPVPHVTAMARVAGCQPAPEPQGHS